MKKIITLLILSLFVSGCYITYQDYEEVAKKQAKKETKCEEILIIKSTANSPYTIKVKACGKYITYICKIKEGCGSFKSRIHCERF